MVKMRILSIRAWLADLRAVRLPPVLARVPRPRVAGAVALVLLTAACSSGPSGAQAAQTASQARPPVAREYWNVLGVLQPVLSTKLGPGTGAFSACPVSSGQPSQVSYSVTTDAVPQNGNLSTSAFLAELEQGLQSHGWGNFTASGGSMVSGNGQFHVYLRPQTGNVAFAVVLTVAGPCVTTGTTFAAAVDDINGSLHDEYPYAELSARPVPTAPLPSP
jgi:hypothetical protein